MKRKNFSNLKIEVQTEKVKLFEHEGFIAGSPPFLRGVTSTKTKHNKPSKFDKFDLSDIKLTKELIQRYTENKNSDSILITNIKESNSEAQIAQILKHLYTILLNATSEQLKIDSITSKMCLGWNVSKNLAFEIAKIRATRMLRAKMIKQFHPKNTNTLALNIFITNNNCTASLITEMSEAHTYNPNTEIEQYIQNETFINKTIDPWAGSSIIESITEEFYTNTWNLFLELQKKIAL